MVVVGVETGGLWSDEAMQFITVGGLEGQGSTSSDAVQHVLGLATALEEDDRHLLRTGGRSFTGLVEGKHSRQVVRTSPRTCDC